MEGIVVLILLIVVGRIGLVVWLVSKAVSPSSAISELTRRQDRN